MGLTYTTQSEIDRTKWDDCIIKANNSLIYCQSFYLNNCTDKQWDAIILNDYEAVMPVTYRKKYGIKYLYQPAFLAQAGIFCEYDLSATMVSDFIKIAVSRFKLIEINLNYKNTRAAINGANFCLRNNFVLDLKESYETIASGYKSNFRKNLKEAKKHDLSFHAGNNFSETIDLFRRLYSKKMTSVTDQDYEHLEQNCKQLFERNDLVVREVKVGNIIYAAVILLRDKNRLYNIASCITPAGRKNSANYFLYDKIIEEFSASHLKLDLEGSDIKGIADFYKSMNPVNEPYYSLRVNNLPALIKFFKK